MLAGLTRRLLARPKGPLGQRPGGEYLMTIPYRSEQTMLRTENHTGLNSNIRELYKKPLLKSGLRAIPRDFGELPRNYVLKILFLHQPVRLMDLWEECKLHDDVPLDSAKHLRHVLKIASKMKWVYAEKNQTNNLWYYYVHQSRSAEVQAMIRQESVVKKETERAKEAQAATDAEAQRVQAASALDDSILALQTMLIQNVSRISEFDPEYVRSLPYVTDSGSVNVAWHYAPAEDAAE